MGEAKKRGSFEQRRSQAEDVRNAMIAERLAKERQRKLAEIEKEAQLTPEERKVKNKTSQALMFAAMLGVTMGSMNR